MKTTLKKLFAGALIATTALALGGCKQNNEKKNGNSEEVAKSNDTDRGTSGGTAQNDRHDERNKGALSAPPPSTGDELGERPQMNEPSGATPQSDTALNTQGNPGSPEIAHNGPQGTAAAPQTDVTPPDNTLAGTNNPTGPSPANDQAQGTELRRSTAFGQQGTDTTVAANEKSANKSALNKAENQDLKPADTTDPQARREAAYSQAAERLSKLDARVSELRSRVDALSNKAAFTETLTDLRKLHETAQSAIDQLRDHNVKLDDARESADRRMTEFEAAINSVQKRIEKAASAT